MLPGPIFSVEMLTTARRSRYTIVRTLYAGVLFLTLAWVYYESVRWSHWDNIQRVAAFMANFFSTFGVIQIAAVLLLGPAMAAGTIAVERERRTFEYLLVSDLSSAEIVFGKLTARLLLMVAIVLAGIPVLALAMLMGGIPPESLLVLTVLTVSTMAMVAVLSILVSVWSRTTRDAVMRAYLILAALLIVPPCAWAAQNGSAQLLPGWVDWCNGQVLMLNPFWVFAGAMQGVASNQAGEAWRILGVMVRNQCLFTVLGAALAAWSVRRVRLTERAARNRSLRWLPRLRPGIGKYPMLWKEAFSGVAATRLGIAGRIALVLLVMVILGTTLYQFWSMVASSGFSDGLWFLRYAVIMGTVVGSGVLVLVGTRAASSVTAERERDTWLSLLSAPLSPQEIVWGKVLGSIWAARWIYALLVFILGLGFLVHPVFALGMFAMMATLAVLSLFASALGVWSSLVCRTSLRAIGMTISIGVFVGGGYLFCCIPLFARGGDGGVVFFAPCMPFLLAMPGVLSAEMAQGNSMTDPGGAMLGAYMIGMMGYTLASLGIIGEAIGNFENRAGRTVPKASVAPPVSNPFRPGHSEPSPPAR